MSTLSIFDRSLAKPSEINRRFQSFLAGYIFNGPKANTTMIDFVATLPQNGFSTFEIELNHQKFAVRLHESGHFWVRVSIDSANSALIIVEAPIQPAIIHGKAISCIEFAAHLSKVMDLVNYTVYPTPEGQSDPESQNQQHS